MVALIALIMMMYALLLALIANTRPGDGRARDRTRGAGSQAKQRQKWHETVDRRRRDDQADRMMSVTQICFDILLVLFVGLSVRPYSVVLWAIRSPALFSWRV